MFDSIKSIQEADFGKLVAAESKTELLGFFRAMARSIARKNVHRECNSSALSLHAWSLYGIDVSKILGNASGSLFKGGEWFFTGRWEKSVRIRSHGRDVKVWRLREGH
jgi:hypothetical protein